VAGRIREDMETSKALLACRSLEDIGAVQSRYFRTAMEQYSAEASRLMGLALRKGPEADGDQRPT
jgi:hypothetical protein